MTVHSFHPDVHEHGLQDGCDRCFEHAMSLDSLDHRMLSNLQDRLESGEEPRSMTEAVAMENLLTRKGVK